MGIYIEGMKMPTGYVELGIALDADGHPTAVTRDGKIFDVIPVPEHGKLKDADALWVEIHKICNRRDAGIISDLTCLQQLLSAVRHAPAIIPAEEGE